MQQCSEKDGDISELKQWLNCLTCNMGCSRQSLMKLMSHELVFVHVL